MAIRDGVKPNPNFRVGVGGAVLFFFNDTATTEIYTLSLHDALPILPGQPTLVPQNMPGAGGVTGINFLGEVAKDRKSTRLNSSHSQISYAVFCLIKKISAADTACQRCRCRLFVHPTPM